MPKTKISQDVRQDHKGRNYRVEYFAASGKIRQFIYVEDATKLPAGYVVPTPKVEERRPVLTLKPAAQLARRLAIVEARHSGERNTTKFQYDNPQDAQRLVDELCRPLMRFDGKEWYVVFPTTVDHYTQRHEEV